MSTGLPRLRANDISNPILIEEGDFNHHTI
jgi:hypothetical protein